ncbi:MAG: DNA replication/repair protein RecF [Anaerolineae bacterium]
MHLTHLSLTNFRNYGRLELDIPLGTTLLHGRNAQGKTNLLEAIYYLATSRSPHADKDQQMVNWEAAQTEAPIVVGRLVAQVATETETRHIEMRLILEKNQSLRNGQRSFRREALVNRRKVRLMDLLGNLRVVLFLPEDMQLITGPPIGRRRYMDITLCQIDPIYCRKLSQYNKTIEQRNALLRQISEGVGSPDMLPIYDERVIELGSHIFSRRVQFLADMEREAKRIHYEELTGGAESIHLSYLPRLEGNQANHRDQSASIHDQFAAALSQNRQTDIARGATTMGPHRDDWQFEINGRALSSFGSRGQQRSALLALKMAEINWMAAQTGDTPILLLDEVVAELDERRRALLLNYVQKSTQAIVTATDPAMLTNDFLRYATTLEVSSGRILSAAIE